VPRTTITQENRVGGSTERYPKISLAKSERGRIYCYEQPWMEWVHRIEGPKIVNGEQVFIKTTDRNNNEIMKPDMLWISSAICLGDIGILRDKGIDPASCIACREAMQSGDIKGPEVRYAMNVLRYGLRPSSFELAQPPSLSPIAWTFPGSRYDKILELQNITGQPAVSSPGAPAMYDVLLGPCEDSGYQKYNIAHAPLVAWQQVPGASGYIAQILPNRATDAQLRDLCGSERTMSQIQQDVTQAKLAFSQARNAGQQPSNDVFGQTFGGQDLAGQVDSLMTSAGQFASQAPGQAVGFPTAAPAGIASTPVAGPSAVAAPADPFAGMVPASQLGQPQAAPPQQAFSAPGSTAGHPGGLAEFSAPADPQMQAAAQYQTAVDNGSMGFAASAAGGGGGGGGFPAPVSPPASVLAAPAAPAAPAVDGDMSLESLMRELG
jgi:hypothetical protein